MQVLGHSLPRLPRSSVRQDGGAGGARALGLGSWGWGLGLHPHPTLYFGWDVSRGWDEDILTLPSRIHMGREGQGAECF